MVEVTRTLNDLGGCVKQALRDEVAAHFGFVHRPAGERPLVENGKTGKRARE